MNFSNDPQAAKLQLAEGYLEVSLEANLELPSRIELYVLNFKTVLDKIASFLAGQNEFNRPMMINGKMQ